MAAVVPIASLTNRSVRVRIQARVFKIWPAFNLASGQTFGMNFLLLDDKNSVMQGYISIRDYQKVSHLFIEGYICEFARFIVQHAKTDFRVVKNSYSLLFTKETTILPLPENSINAPLLFFNVRHLEDIGTAIFGENTIVDVVARISGFGPIQNIQKDEKMARVRTMYLANERDFILDVSLWEQFIDIFDSTVLAEQSKTSPVVVACSSMQLRKYKAKYGLKTFSGSCFYFDKAIPEIN